MQKRAFSLVSLGLVGLSIGLFSRLETAYPAFTSPDWCTSSADQWGIGGKWVNVFEACRGHDICYWTIGAKKETCDRNFYNDLKQICDREFGSERSLPSRKTCYDKSGAYYDAVRGVGSFRFFTCGIAKRSFESAQSEAKRVVNRLETMSPTVDLSRYYPGIAWELAYRQANGESVDESIENATQTIARKISSNSERIPSSINASVSGLWKWGCCQGKYYGEMELTQRGEKIIGKFKSPVNNSGGVIDGTIEGSELKFTLEYIGNYNGEKQFYELSLSPDGQVLEGTFKGFKDPDQSIGVQFKAIRQ